MKKSTDVVLRKGIIAMMAVAVLFSLSSKAFAMAVCLSGPWGDPPIYCPAEVTITPAKTNAAYGESVSIALHAYTLFEWSTGGWADVEATMSDGTVLYSDWPAATGMDVNVPSGPLTSSVTLNIWGLTNQGVYDSDSSFITVAPPAPTVNLYFSILDTLKSFMIRGFFDRAFASTQ